MIVADGWTRFVEMAQWRLVSRRAVAMLCLCAVAGGLLFASPAAAQSSARSRLVFCCKPENDLYNLLSQRGGKWQRFDRPGEAIRYAAPDSGVLILAEGYPDELTVVAPELFDLAAEKKVRIYIEYAKNVPGMISLDPRQVQTERVVVANDWFAPSLEKLSILSMHECSFVPMDAAYSFLVLARVAGFNTAVFGLEPWKSPIFQGGTAFPLLVKNPIADILVSTSKLSSFMTGRYAPRESWRFVWERILTWLAGERVILSSWDVDVAPAYGKEDVLPPDAGVQAMRSGVQWFSNARLLVHPSWQAKVDAASNLKDRVGPAPESQWAIGDGALGLLEGVTSTIDVAGSQPVRYWFRYDCMSEAAMALAFDGVANQVAKSGDVSGNLNSYIYTTSELAQGPRSDPKSPSYGLLGWSRGPGESVYYGDDNSRGLLATIASSALLKKDQWDESILRCLLANLRTTGPLGFRQNALQEDALQKAGWQHYFNMPIVEPAPHYQAYLWSAFLWAYKQTGYAPFLDRAKAGIGKTMECYPDKWKWTNGIQQERARMLLPLAWLVRIEDTPEHRAWLGKVAKDLLALQDACGAIQEQFGAPELGTIPPPKSNEEYGKTETPIIQQNGDTASDMLYTCNFALFGLHEAAAATGEALYDEAERNLADFLCRIQIRSVNRPELDGGWYRAFDFQRWEYWGSNGDNGWGAWSIETGWTQGWICSTLALRKMKVSFWDLTSSSQIKKHLDGLVAAMLPGAFETPADEKVADLAVGKPVTSSVAYTAPFSGGGSGALTDGRIAKPDHTHPAWQGIEGSDWEVVVDLGAPMAVKRLQMNFLQSGRAGVLLPSSVEYAVSLDASSYTVVGTIANDVPAATEGPAVKSFSADIPETQARYIRIVAKSAGDVPDGLPGTGKKSLLFADEILVQ